VTSVVAARSVSASSCARARNDSPNTATGGRAGGASPARRRSHGSIGVGARRTGPGPAVHPGTPLAPSRDSAAPTSAACQRAVASPASSPGTWPTASAGIQSGRDSA
jgi:hypothetical protein